MKMRTIELFCGCGGMSVGLKNAGFDIVYANDINEDALKTYRKNFPEVHVECKDIMTVRPNDIKKKLKLKKIDLIVAGTPCQGFSTSGKRNPNDPRNKLFRQLFKFVNNFKPKFFVMENVSGLLSMEEGKVFKKITKSFEGIGYHIQHDVLTASDFGIPQHRKRVFIVGSRKKFRKSKLFPRKQKRKTVTVRDAISDLSFLGIGESSSKYHSRPKTKYQKLMRKNSRVLHNHESARHSKKIQNRFAAIPIGMDGRNFFRKPRTSKRDLFKLHPKKPSRTITTLPEDFIHYEKNRIHTVRELARLQSFPDSFEFLGPRTTGGKQRKYSCPQYTQVGNAVPPLLSEKIFRKLHKILRAY